jgi:uncharacterized protein GlcG (DUF336 family)
MVSFVKRSIDLVTAQVIMDGVKAKAAELNLRMSIAVCDESGDLKSLVRMDGASLLSLQIAQDKAYTSSVTRMPSHAWHDFIKDDAPLLHGIVHVPRLIIFGGGFPLKEEEMIVGAVGVSGGHYSQDMECARAGLAAAGFA